MTKLLWLDCETSGLVPYKHGILQLAGIVEINGEVKEEFNLRMKPGPEVALDSRALGVNKITEEDLKTYPPSHTQYNVFVSMLDKYINKYDKTDKFILAGYNVQFDDGFVREWFKRHGNNYWNSYVEGAKLDVMSTAAAWATKKKTKPANFKLGTVAKLFELDGNFHDALDDIKITRDLHYKILSVM